MNFKYLTLLLIPLFFVACDKEEEAVADKNAPSAIEQKIINFKAELTSTSKEEITYTLEEAEWNLEALLNYEEANNEHNYHNLHFEKDVYQVPVINGSISSSDLLAAYIHFLKKIEATTLDETIFSDLVDLTIVEPEEKDGEVNIEMTFSYGSGIALYTYNQFVENEDWKWGFNGGPCAGNPSFELTDASNLLQAKINNPIIQGPSGYFTDVYFRQTTGFEWEEDNSNPAYPFRNTIIFVGHDIDQCLEHEELNFYLNKFDYIKNQLNDNDDFKQVEIMDSLIPGKDGTYFHVYNLYFGTFHQGSGGGIL